MNLTPFVCYRNADNAKRRLPLVVLLCAALSMLPGCSAESAAPDAADAPGRDAQPAPGGKSLHVVYWGRTVREDGEPSAIHSYRESVRICEAAGITVKPLAESDVEKLGKKHYERWMDERHNVLVEHWWDLGSAPGDDLATSCQFRLEARKFAEGLDSSWEIHPADAETLASVHQANLAAGWRREGRKTVLGQPCVIWVKGGNRLCLLDAPELGFYDDVSVHDDCATVGDAGFESMLPLEQVQAPEKRNCEFKVDLIEIGKPLDASQWQAAAKGA